MKKKIISLSIAIITTISAFGQMQTWTLDKAHAKLGFTVSHLMVSEVEGFFKSFDINLAAKDEKFTDAVIEVTAQINSIDTYNERRDKHLKSPDFFDAEKYPTLSFNSKSFTKVSDKNYKLTGDLTMHGIKKPVTLDVIFNGTLTHPYTKKTIAGFKITGTLNRSDFNVGGTYNETTVGDEVHISVNAEFIKD